MNAGFKVSYIKNGDVVVLFAPSDRDAKKLIVAALQDKQCSNIAVKQA